MKTEIYDDLAMEQIVKDAFGVPVDISQMVASKIPVSYTAEATVFLTKKKQLFVYVHARSKLLLSDVKKILSRMGLKGGVYFPPKNQPDYFDQIGREKFREVFPGRANISNEDIIFYRTLAPYSPALVQIQEVKNGEIKKFDADTSGNWRVAAKFAYRRIKTS